MNLKQYLIGKEKSTLAYIEGFTPDGVDRYNQCLKELLSDLPQLEKELMEEIGNPGYRHLIKNEFPNKNFAYSEGTSVERSRLRTIIHNFFN